MKNKSFPSGLLLAAAALLILTVNGFAQPTAETWQTLFNGKDLTGWTPKIKGYELGENFADTFRVENGILRVVYDGYEKFDNRFGHLFYQIPFSNYVLRV